MKLGTSDRGLAGDRHREKEKERQREWEGMSGRKRERYKSVLERERGRFGGG